jgi:hypothetical protein
MTRIVTRRPAVEDGPVDAVLVFTHHHLTPPGECTTCREPTFATFDTPTMRAIEVCHLHLVLTQQLGVETFNLTYAAPRRAKRIVRRPAIASAT